MLSAAFNIVGFSWITSPAATELEVIVLDWFAKMLRLPSQFLSTGKYSITFGFNDACYLNCSSQHKILVGSLFSIVYHLLIKLYLSFQNKRTKLNVLVEKLRALWVRVIFLDKGRFY